MNFRNARQLFSVSRAPSFDISLENEIPLGYQVYLTLNRRLGCLGIANKLIILAVCSEFSETLVINTNEYGAVSRNIQSIEREKKKWMFN